MDGHERMVRAIEFGGPDRIPMLHVVLPGAAAKFGRALEELLAEYPDDAGGWWRKLAYTRRLAYAQVRYTDEWGCTWENLHSGLLGRIVYHPLADWENWARYRFPPLPPPQQFLAVDDEAARSRHSHYIFGSGGVFGDYALFHQMIALRGYEDLMVDLATGERHVYMLRDALLERYLAVLKQDVMTAADGIGFGDDWGTQSGLMVSPSLWRRFFRPAYQEMFSVARAAGKHVHFHTDGATFDILGDLVNIGATVLNVQHATMDIRKIAREFGGKVAFRSDVSSQGLLQWGTRQQIYDHVREVIDCLGSYNGGLIGHGEIQPDQPLENVRWMLEAFRELGNC